MPSDDSPITYGCEGPLDRATRAGFKRRFASFGNRKAKLFGTTHSLGDNWEATADAVPERELNRRGHAQPETPLRGIPVLNEGGEEVNGTIGIVIRAVSEDELSEEEGKRLVERMDERGLHMTAQLRQQANELIEDAARD